MDITNCPWPNLDNMMDGNFVCFSLIIFLHSASADSLGGEMEQGHVCDTETDAGLCVCVCPTSIRVGYDKGSYPHLPHLFYLQTTTGLDLVGSLVTLVLTTRQTKLD